MNWFSKPWADQASHSQVMDHSDHKMDPDMDMCSMSMLFTWDYKNLCVVFKWWHVRTFFDLALTMAAISLLAIGYEYFRYRVHVLEHRQFSTVANPPGGVKDLRLIKSIAYAIQVGYSYFLMLVFMTYNAWAMLAVCVGAGAGFYLFGNRASRELNCH